MQRIEIDIPMKAVVLFAATVVSQSVISPFCNAASGNQPELICKGYTYQEKSDYRIFGKEKQL